MAGWNYLCVYLFCNPGVILLELSDVLDTADHIPFVGLHGGWGTKLTNNKKQTMASNHPKSVWEDGDSDSESEIRERAKGVPGAWPRFLVVSSADEARPISKLSPFAVQKGFAGISSRLTKIKRMRDGSLLVECTTQRDSELLMRSNDKNFVDRPIKVSAHRSLNTSKGVIRCRDLAEMTEAEIREELASQGVLHVHRVQIKKGETRVPTGTYFLTFCTSLLPKSIRVGYLNVGVSHFVPAPMRCYKCQRFGHSKFRCTQKAVCEHCGGDAHEGSCPAAPVCTNCKGEHAPSSKDCPKYKFEQAVQKLRTEQNISFPEAKAKVLASMPTCEESYASKAASSGANAQIPSSKVEKVLEKMAEALDKFTDRLDRLEKIVHAIVRLPPPEATSLPPSEATKSPPPEANKPPPPEAKKSSPPGTKTSAPAGATRLPTQAVPRRGGQKRTTGPGRAIRPGPKCSKLGVLTTKKAERILRESDALQLSNRFSSLEEIEVMEDESINIVS